MKLSRYLKKPRASNTELPSFCLFGQVCHKLWVGNYICVRVSCLLQALRSASDLLPLLKVAFSSIGIFLVLSGDSRMPSDLDPVAETAIRQLTETNNKTTKKTPTKRSTLIISGVSKVSDS